MEEYVASAIASGNTRISKVRTFLSKPPKRTAFLRLVAAGAEDTAQVPLGEWQPEEILPELAPEIVAILDAHASEMQAHITATLAYVDERGQLVKALTLKRQGNHVMGGDTAGLLGPEEMNSQLTGDARSQAQGAQRHLEVMARVYMAGMAGLLAHSERLVSRQSDMLETLASRLVRAERRVDAKEHELEDVLELVREARAAAPAEGSPVLDRAIAMLERLAPHLLQQFMTANTQQHAAPSAPADEAA